MITWDKWVGTRIMVESARIALIRAMSRHGGEIDYASVIDKIRQEYVFALLNPEE